MHASCRTSCLHGYCSTAQGLLDWFEVDLGFTELLFIQIDLCVMFVFVLYSPVSHSSCFHHIRMLHVAHTKKIPDTHIKNSILILIIELFIVAIVNECFMSHEQKILDTHIKNSNPQYSLFHK